MFCLIDEWLRIFFCWNDEKNSKLYAEYKKLAESEKNIIFGGRLGEYKYYDMDAVIASALKKSKMEIV